ncbi:outer membrane protein assembly factor BamC [Candidatus Ishikawella capsulata]|nr:outer membrane protein assembly factor BamC [Candidatus Ishikawaella capsulata]
MMHIGDFYSYTYRADIDTNRQYLLNQKTDELQELNIPKDFSLKIKNKKIQVSNIVKPEELADKLDIRPPMQLLKLINGEYIDSADDTYEVLIDGYCNSLWNNIIKVMKYRNVPIYVDNINQQLTTSWITWKIPEYIPYHSKYKITLKVQNNKQILILKLIDLQSYQKSITSAIQRHKYNALMMNEISKGLNRIYYAQYMK